MFAVIALVALGYSRATFALKSGFRPFFDQCELFCSNKNLQGEYVALRIEGIDRRSQSLVKGYFTGGGRSYEEWDAFVRPVKNGFEIINSKYCNQDHCLEFLSLKESSPNNFSGVLTFVDGGQCAMQCTQECISKP